MSIELRQMSEEPPIGKLKLALVGAEKNGKSRLASTGRKPILFHDFDNRAESLQGIPGVFVISYIDPVWPQQPTAAQDFLTVIGKLEQSLDLSELGFKVPKGTILKTNVIDSIQTCGKAVGNYALYNSKDLRREVTFGSHKVFFQANWDAWKAEMVEVENQTLRMLAFPTDTIIILHETSEEADDSTEKTPHWTGRIGVYPVRYKCLLKYFNELWRVKLTQSLVNNQLRYVPRVYPLPTYEFDCATTMLLDSIEEPNIEAMLLKHEQRLKTQNLTGASPKALPQVSQPQASK